MNTTKILRADIMELLFEVDNETVLQSLYQQLKSATQKQPNLKPKYQNEDDILAIAKEPIPDYLPFEQIVAVQGGFSMDKFNETIDKIDFTTFEDESLEDMLNAIKL